MSVIKLNPDAEMVAMVQTALKENDGYCPCRLTKTPETKCMCKEFRDFFKNGGVGACHCGLYVIYGDEWFEGLIDLEVDSVKASQNDILGRMIAEDQELKLKVKKLSDDAIIPTKGTIDSAGFDLYATDDLTIKPQTSVMVHTGLSMEIPKGYVGLIFARSGLANKKHLRPSNCVGVVDADYRGEVMVSLFNDTADTTHFVGKGERVAQLSLIPYISPKVVVCDKLSDTDRGEGGFGSTGK